MDGQNKNKTEQHFIVNAWNTCMPYNATYSGSEN